MKIAKRLLLILISAVMMIGGCGCGMFVSESQLKQTLENALQEKYNEEFSCLNVWSNGGSSYWGVCAPERNHDIRFEALFNADGHIAEEGYYAACVSEKIEENVQEELEYVFNDFYLHSYMTVPLYSFENDDIYAENVRNESFDIDEYVSYVKEKREDRTSITLIMLVNSEKSNKLSFEEEYQVLSNICKSIKGHDINPRAYLKFIPEEKYSECMKYLEEKNSTNDYFDDMVRDYFIKVSDISLDVCFEFEGDSPITITKEEYIKQRKEVS